jgi:hypothetical protein
MFYRLARSLSVALGAVSAARGGFFGFRPLFGTPYRDATSPDRTLCTV